MIIFSPRVKIVITYSKENLRLGHDFMNRTPDAGILRDGNGKAIQILNNLLST
jgi:ATP-dependent Clp protease ATP-binding subunit ClpC